MTQDDIPVEPTQAEEELEAWFLRRMSGGCWKGHVARLLARHRLAHQTPPATQPSATVGEVEEAIARVIYPEAFAEPTPHQNTVYRCMGYHEARADGLALASAILATLHTPPPVATATVVEQERLRELVEAADEAWQGLKQTQLAASEVGIEIAQSVREGYGLHLTIALRELLATLHTPPAMVVDAGWQPIETLPDGVPVIGRKVNQDGTGYGVIVGVKHPSARKNGEWVIDEWAGKSARCTHWMLLAATPTPPAGDR